MRNAIQRLALLPIVALFLLPAACHRTDGRAEALLNNADSLLTANPDSALRLLEALPATTELTRRESARPAAGTSHRQMRKTSATLRLATGRGTGLL